MAIPGHQDAALQRFEDGLYAELCRQHDRLDLFVASKADEISRRLAVASESDEEAYASSECYLSYGYYVLSAPAPSLSKQDVNRYRENVLFWGTIGCFIASFILLAVASILMFTGRHKL
ncbi:hypothetical protein FALCPG4_018734 [Fusarium falciforme]